jgi:hypothetical protein
MAAVAMVLLAVAGWLWGRSRPSGHTAAAVVLDLRGCAPARGENRADSRQPATGYPSQCEDSELGGANSGARGGV